MQRTARILTMAELGIAASITSILQFSSAVIQYLVDVKNASKDRQKLILEIGSVTGLLFLLQDLAERAQWADPWLASIRALGVPHGPLAQFKGAMERLASKLRLGNRWAWPFEKKEIDNVLQTIERQKTLFALALQNDH